MANICIWLWYNIEKELTILKLLNKSANFKDREFRRSVSCAFHNCSRSSEDTWQGTMGSVPVSSWGNCYMRSNPSIRRRCILLSGSLIIMVNGIGLGRQWKGSVAAAAWMLNCVELQILVFHPADLFPGFAILGTRLFLRPNCNCDNGGQPLLFIFLKLKSS